MNPVRRKRRRWKRVLAYLALVLLCLMLGGMTFVGVLYYQVAQMMPSVNVLEGYKPREASEIYSADGVLLARIAEEYREPVPLSQIPQHLINATIAKEDRRFWSHHGVDWRGIARAAWVNLVQGEIQQGAAHSPSSWRATRSSPNDALSAANCRRLSWHRSWSAALARSAFWNSISIRSIMAMAHTE
jgi:hypothetical protein